MQWPVFRGMFHEWDIQRLSRRCFSVRWWFEFQDTRRVFTREPQMMHTERFLVLYLNTLSRRTFSPGYKNNDDMKSPCYAAFLEEIHQRFFSFPNWTLMYWPNYTVNYIRWFEMNIRNFSLNFFSWNWVWNEHSVEMHFDNDIFPLCRSTSGYQSRICLHLMCHML